MSWHYAIVKRHTHDGGEYYAVHEVFRREDNNKIWSMTEDPITIGTEILDEVSDPVKSISDIVETILKDIKHYPIVNEEDVPEDEPPF